MKNTKKLRLKIYISNLQTEFRFRGQIRGPIMNWLIKFRRLFFWGPKGLDLWIDR